MQIAPPPALSPFIKHYLFIQEYEGQGRLRLFQDGNTGLVFCRGARFSGSDMHREGLPEVFVYGQPGGFREVTANGRQALIIVVFHPYGINHLLGIPAPELFDQVIPAENLWGNTVLELAAELHGQAGLPEQVRLLDTFFYRRPLPGPDSKKALMRAAAVFIQKNGGQVRISTLCDFLGYQERQVERIFREHTGLTPKNFCNVVQLHRVIHNIRQFQEFPTLLDAGAEAGYFDQAHFIRRFRRYTGFTPSEYSSNRRALLAANFLQVPDRMK